MSNRRHLAACYSINTELQIRFGNCCALNLQKSHNISSKKHENKRSARSH